VQACTILTFLYALFYVILGHAYMLSELARPFASNRGCTASIQTSPTPRVRLSRLFPAHSRK
jgi:hypothetical protein